MDKCNRAFQGLGVRTGFYAVLLSVFYVGLYIRLDAAPYFSLLWSTVAVRGLVSSLFVSVSLVVLLSGDPMQQKIPLTFSSTVGDIFRQQIDSSLVAD